MEDLMEIEPTSRASFSVQKFSSGLILIAFGGILFLNAIDLLSIHGLVRFWPLLPIAFGLVSEVESLRRKTSGGGGLALLSFGVWMLAGSLHVYGLNVASALPLGIVVLGLGTVVHALVDLPNSAPTTAKKEDGHVDSIQ
jgi:LiaF transmembrane domain